MSFFTKHRTGIISSIVQLLLIAILFPLILQILATIIPLSKADANSFVFSLLDSIPLFDTWVSLLKDYFTAAPLNGNGTPLDVLLYNSEYINSTFSITKILFDSLLLTFCVQGANRVQDLTSMTGPHIVSTFTGVFVAIILKILISLIDENLLGQLTYYIGLIAIILIGIFIMIKSVSSKRFIGFINVSSAFISAISAIITTCYITIIIMAVNGYAGDMKTRISLCFTVTVIELINVICSALISSFFDDKKAVFIKK